MNLDGSAIEGSVAYYDAFQFTNGVDGERVDHIERHQNSALGMRFVQEIEK